MKKIVFMLLVLSLFSFKLKAQEVAGVDPCNSGAVRAFVVTGTISGGAGGVWVSSENKGGSGGGILCGAMISSAAASTVDFMYCASSSPSTLDASGNVYVQTATVNANIIVPANTDSRLMFTHLVATTTGVTTLGNNNGAGFKPTKFKNLFCGISTAGTPGIVYFVPNFK